MRTETMKPNVLRHVVVASAVVTLVALSCSCSSSNNGGGAEGSDGGPLSDGSAIPPDAFVAVQVGGGGGACNLPSPDTSFFDVGTATADRPTTVVSGGSNGSGTVSITCKVHPSGSGFDIALSVSVAGSPGGNVTITSPAGAGAVTTSGGTGITTSFYASNMGPYSSNDCTLTFSYQGQPVPVAPAIAKGRIWGHIDCPDAAESGQTTTGPDGGQTAVACPASADFLFEQCEE